MRNTKKIFRKAIYDALNNVISVPVYDEKKHVGDADAVYVLLSTQQETNQTLTDCTWITLSTLDISIVVRTPHEVTKDVQDDIEEEILEILFPVAAGDVLETSVSGFLIQNMFRESSLTRNLSITPTDSVLETIIRISATITEQR